MPDRLTTLRAMLARREGHNEYRDSVEAIKAEIARLEALNRQDINNAPAEMTDLGAHPEEWR